MSRSKKNWNQLVDWYGNYVDLSNINGVPGPKGSGGDPGDEGQKGDEGKKGDTGEKGLDATPFLFWASDVATKGDLPPSELANNGYVYKANDTGYLYIDNGGTGYTEVSNFDLIQGEKGDTGGEGNDGQKGIKGSQGIQGQKGEEGLGGSQGQKGDEAQQGVSGAKGEKGDQGIQGAEGIEGVQGVPGNPGQNGLGIEIIGSIPNPGPPASGDCTNAGDAILDSDGNIWICDGSGSWIPSGPIQGPEGPQGVQGVQGSQGIQGTQGVQGDQGEKGNVGRTGSKGEKGIIGITGDKGEGAQAITIIGGFDGTGTPPSSVCDTAGNGLIDTDGIIWVCDGSGNWIEMPSQQGVKGNTGADGGVGADGEKGEEGLQGIKGSQGIQGIQGIQGVDGVKGDLGVPGMKGLKGVKGAQGESPFSFLGELPTVPDLPTDPEVGDVWKITADGKFYLWNGTGWVEIDFDTTAMPEPPDDKLYGRSFDGAVGSWEQTVKHSGDEMTGPLSSPVVTTGPDTNNRAILKMDDGVDQYELEADPTFIKFESEYLAKQSDVTILQNSVVNLAETQAVLAPTDLFGAYVLRADGVTTSGEFFIDSADGSFSGTMEIILDASDQSGADHSVDFTNLAKYQYVSVLSLTTPYGVSGRISRVPTVDANGRCTIPLTDIVAVDVPASGAMPAGAYSVKVQNILDPENIKEINLLLEGLNGSFNNVADYRSVVLMDANDTPPSYLPTGNAVPEGKLYFNTQYLQLYIRVNGSWLGLL